MTCAIVEASRRTDWNIDAKEGMFPSVEGMTEGELGREIRLYESIDRHHQLSNSQTAAVAAHHKAATERLRQLEGRSA